MALIGTIGSTIVQTTSNSFQINVTTALSTGNTIIGAIASENNAGHAPALTITDVRGNTYTIDRQMVDVNNNTVTVTIFSARVTSALSVNDKITVSNGSETRTRWLATVQAFDDIIAGTRVDRTASNAAASSSFSSGTTAATTDPTELVYAAFGFGVRTFTPGSGFTASAQVATTVGSADRALNSEWQYVAITGPQTATATASSSVTYAGAIVTYKASSANQAPTANAGPDQAVTVSSTVTLDGTGSSDPDGTITDYQWTQISGPSVTLSSSTASQPTFTAPSSPATLVFGLVVTDNLNEDSAQDTVTISVQDKVGYVAEAGHATSTTTGTSFDIPISKTVQIGHTLLVSVVVDDPAISSVAPVMSATDTQGNTYTMDAQGYRDDTLAVTILSCYVTDALTPSDTITVTSDTVRGRWAATVAEFDNIHQNSFDVAASMNGNPSTNLVSGTTVATENQVEVVFASFGFGMGSSPTFSAGAHYQQAGSQQGTTFGSSDRGVAAEYRIYTASATHEATATLTSASGYAGAIATYAADLITDVEPVADAGSNQTVAAFEEVTLDASGSSDEDGVVVDYLWTQTDGPTVSLSSDSVVQPTFIAPGSEEGTSVTFSLVVTDNLGEDSTNSAEVTITIGAAEQFIASGDSWRAVHEQIASGGEWL